MKDEKFDLLDLQMLEQLKQLLENEMSSDSSEVAKKSSKLLEAIRTSEEEEKARKAEEREEDDDEEEYDNVGENVDKEIDYENFERPSFEKSIAFLDDMVGMEHIKQKLVRLARYIQWQQRIKELGGDTREMPRPNLTFIFMGDPGTGKTTVAKKMGEVLFSLHLLEEDRVYVYRREDLVGENYGAEEIRTKEALNTSRGGVLLLDEAYQCFKGATDQRDPGYHILETLMPELDTPGRCIILAGYKDEMLKLMQVNSGFRSRIPEENILEFQKPNEERLVEIVERRLGKMEMRMTQKAQRILQDKIHEQFIRKDSSFGNARQMRQITDSMVIAHANRVMSGQTFIENRLINSSDVMVCMQEQAKQAKTVTRNPIGFA